MSKDAAMDGCVEDAEEFWEATATLLPMDASGRLEIGVVVRLFRSSGRLMSKSSGKSIACRYAHSNCYSRSRVPLMPRCS